MIIEVENEQGGSAIESCKIAVNAKANLGDVEQRSKMRLRLLLRVCVAKSVRSSKSVVE